jgi:hypothetical protein
MARAKKSPGGLGDAGAKSLPQTECAMAITHVTHHGDTDCIDTIGIVRSARGMTDARGRRAYRRSRAQKKSPGGIENRRGSQVIPG